MAMDGKIYIGLDPGKDGAFAVVKDGKILCYGVYPKIGKEVDYHAVANFIRPYVVEGDMVAISEKLKAVRFSGDKQKFEMGRSMGSIEGLAAGLGAPCLIFTPRTWQKVMWEGTRTQYKTELDKETKIKKEKVDTKATSLLAAKALYPRETFLKNDRCRVAHDGIVDAVLLATYGYRKGL